MHENRPQRCGDVCVCVCVCVHACVHACVCTCVYAVRVCVYECVVLRGPAAQPMAAARWLPLWTAACGGRREGGGGGGAAAAARGAVITAVRELREGDGGDFAFLTHKRMNM